MKRTLTVIGIVVGLVLVLLVGHRLIAKPGAGALAYAVAPATYGSLSVNVTGSGTVQSATTANVYPSQAGTITSVGVTVGSQVVAGQLLATESDGGKLENQLLAAQAALAADQASLAAATEPPAASQAQITAQEDKVQLDQQRLTADQQVVAGLTVTAPQSGFVQSLNVIPGQSVGAGQTLFTIASPSVITITGNVFQFDLPSLSVGQAATVQTDLGTNLPATITQIGNAASGTVKGQPVFPVTVTLTNPGTELNAGVDVVVLLGTPGIYIMNGPVTYSQVAAVTAPAAGTVSAVDALSGQLVQAGATVLALSSPATQQAVLQDQATLSADQATLATLLNPAPTTAATLASLQARLAADQSAVTEAEIAVAGLRMTSPISGTVTAVNVAVGDNAATAGGATPAFSIENPNALQLGVPIDQTQLAQLAVGQTVQITTDALPGQTLPGTVVSIAPTGTNSLGVSSFNVTININQDAGGSLKSGMAANASIHITTIAHTLMVPAVAVSGSGAQASVVVLVAGRPVVKKVVAGLSNTVDTQIISGLSAGEQVVTATVTPTTGSGLFFGGAGRKAAAGAGGARAPAPRATTGKAKG
ncbi:MAG: efflux RND transporter periplasmic adaptor subunit [Sulfobacillus sp.]